MITVMRRLFWLALLAGGGYAGRTFWQQRSSNDETAAPEWPTLDPPLSEPIATDGDRTLVDAMSSAADTTPHRWVEPVDGGCPDGYPVKANDNSGIHHVPGGRFYERTVPERCYANADDAAADGYRAAKS